MVLEPEIANINTEIENLSDEELVRLIRMNNTDAENVLLSKYKQIVRIRAASYYMAGADREDIIQEGMIGVFKAVYSFDETKGTSFSTFAQLCIQRQIITAIKCASRMKHSPLNNSLSLNNLMSDGDNISGIPEETIIDNKNDDPASLLLMRESLEYIQENLGEILTEMERCIWFMYVQGNTYKEIAEKLDKTDKAVDNAIRRAKKKLNDLWAECRSTE